MKLAILALSVFLALNAPMSQAKDAGGSCDLTCYRSDATSYTKKCNFKKVCCDNEADFCPALTGSAGSGKFVGGEAGMGSIQDLKGGSTLAPGARPVSNQGRAPKRRFGL
jgi:hypothetical protein